MKKTNIFSRLKILIIFIGIVFMLFCALVVFVLLTGFIGLGRNSLDDFFAKWEPQNDSRVLILDTGVAVMEDEENVDYYSILEEYYEWEPNESHFFTVKEGLLYGIVKRYCKIDAYLKTIDVIAIDLNSEELILLHRDNYMPRDEVTGKSVYGAVEFYYFNRCIVICDGEKNVSYNIDTKELTLNSPSDFSYPKEKYEIERIMSEDVLENGFKIKTELEERIITVKDMAERNDYIKSLTDLKATWYVFGIQKPLKSFPSKFFVINDDIYIIGVVYDRDGESNCVVFRYNYVDDTYTFLYHSFHSANSIIDVIPIEY